MLRLIYTTIDNVPIWHGKMYIGYNNNNRRRGKIMTITEQEYFDRACERLRDGTGRASHDLLGPSVRFKPTSTERITRRATADGPDDLDVEPF